MTDDLADGALRHEIAVNLKTAVRHTVAEDLVRVTAAMLLCYFLFVCVVLALTMTARPKDKPKTSKT